MPRAPLTIDIADISSLTPETYAKLDRQELEAVHRLAYQANSALTQLAFADPSVAWVLVAGAPGRIVTCGKRGSRFTDAQIAEMEELTGQVCWFYSRPDELVEEIPREEPRFPWAPQRHEAGTIGPFVDSQAITRQRGQEPFRYDFPDPLVSWPPPHRLAPRLDPNPLRPNGPFAKSTLSAADYAQEQDEYRRGLSRPGNHVSWPPPYRLHQLDKNR